MEKKGNIKGLTKYLEYDEESIYNALKLRFVNKDVSFDIEKKIDEILLFLKKNPKLVKSYKECVANLTYFKYKFLASNDNKYRNLEKAHEYLKIAYKLGSPDAAAQYGYDYRMGTGSAKEKDKEKSNQYFKEAFSSKNSSNYIEYLKAETLAKTFFDDIIPDFSALEEAVKWYQIALSKNVFESKRGLAYCYYSLETNLDLCAQYFKEFDLLTPDREKDINNKKSKLKKA